MHGQDAYLSRRYGDVQPHRGLRAFARVYAGWGFSQAFYRERLYEKIGFSSLEDFLVGFWEGYFLKKVCRRRRELYPSHNADERN
jgi:homoserine O-acetyltransferase